jgi:hypothetical protein
LITDASPRNDRATASPPQRFPRATGPDCRRLKIVSILLALTGVDLGILLVVLLGADGP